ISQPNTSIALGSFGESKAENKEVESSEPRTTQTRGPVMSIKLLSDLNTRPRDPPTSFREPSECEAPLQQRCSLNLLSKDRQPRPYLPNVYDQKKVRRNMYLS